MLYINTSLLDYVPLELLDIDTHDIHTSNYNQFTILEGIVQLVSSSQEEVRGVWQWWCHNVQEAQVAPCTCTKGVAAVAGVGFQLADYVSASVGELHTFLQYDS